MTRTATQADRNFKSKLEALQVEQAGLNRKIKAQRDRANQITAEFYATKDEWRAQSGDDNLTLIVW